MKNNCLKKDTEHIIRVLDKKEDSVLITDCLKLTMPVWKKTVDIASYVDCSQDELLERTKTVLPATEAIDVNRSKVMHERFSMIAPIIPYVGDKRIRSSLIAETAQKWSINQRTIKNYLCLYLSFQNITILIPKERIVSTELSDDEKNMRWSLNKYFYNQNKNSVMTAYVMMLKEKYCDGMGMLLAEYPTIHQYRYFYSKYNKMQNYYISRNGLKDYQMNHRPLVGEGVQDFATNVGIGMLDATVCDIYLVNEAGNIVGRPILTACIDAYSSLCCGYSLSWEGGVYSLRNLMLNVIEDKVEWCKKLGITISKRDWNSKEMPAVLVTDMGSEYTSGNFEQITELGVQIVNLPPYRPELKGNVEKFFDLIQNSYKKHLKGKGVIEPDYQKRGAHDYRKDACLTIEDFEKVIINCILYYNSNRIIENFPYTEQMLKDNVQPFANEIFEWGNRQIEANFIPVDSSQLILTLLPRTNGRFSRRGLSVNGLRYHCDGFTEEYLSDRSVCVAYNPDDVSKVWILDSGNFTLFELIESRFRGRTLTDVQILKENQSKALKGAVGANIQAQIDLAERIETIANGANTRLNVGIKNIREARQREQSKKHIDFVNERGVLNE